MLWRRIDRRRITGGLIASALGVAGSAAGAIIQVRPASRLPAPDEQIYQPPTSLQVVADIYRRMTTEVGVDAQGPFPFVVDTGANQSVISQELAARLNLPIGPSAPLNGVAGVQIAPTTRAAVSMGDRKLPDLALSLLPRAALGGDGILGLDAIDGDELTLDFKTKTLRIDRAVRRWKDSRDIALKAERRDGQLTLVDADLAGIAVTAFLDSGAQNTIGNMALRELAVTRHPTTRWSETPVVSATGQTISAEMAELPEFHIGGLHFSYWPVAFAKLHVFDMWNLTKKPAIVIGVDVMSQFEQVSLDFAHDEVRFRPPIADW